MLDVSCKPDGIIIRRERKTYLEYKERGINILEEHKSEIIKLSEEEDSSDENGENNDE